MSEQYVLHNPPPTDPHDNRPRSTFTPPVNIDLGDEDNENLEAIIKKKTGETVKADEDWTRLSGTRSIDTSVVGGFMFQTDAGIGCSVQVTENGNLPVQILIDEEQYTDMFLVVVLRHEAWTTSGNFHLRFVRRVPVSDKQCTSPLEGVSAGSVLSPSDSVKGSAEEPELSTDDTISVKDEEKEKKATDRAAGTSSSLPAQTPHHMSFKDAYLVPLAGRTGSPENDEDLTDEEDHRGSGAAALKGTGGGIIPPGIFLPPE